MKDANRNNGEPPPRICEPLEQILLRFGGTCEVRSPGIRVEYPLPVASREIRDYLKRTDSLVTAGDFIARLPHGRVFGAGIVLAPDGCSLARDVSTDFGRPLSEHWLLTFNRMGRPAMLGGSVAVTAGALSSGYSHWLLDELPRLLALPQGYGEAVIGHRSREFARSAWALRGGSERAIEPRRTSHFQCDQLVIPSLPSPSGFPTPATLGLLSEFVAPLLQSSSAWGDRIYISRERARRRKVSNENELWSFLEPRGFRCVHLEDLTWREQINSFRHAREIVAPHGAGLANLVFCRPGTKVVELFNRAYVNGCYWRIAALQQLDYRPLVGGTAPGLGEGPKENRLDIPAILAEVKAALEVSRTLKVQSAGNR